MAHVETFLYYGDSLTPNSREDNWVIDAISHPPEAIWNFRKVAVKTIVTDLRESSFEPSLDNNGFQKLFAPTDIKQQALVARSSREIEQYQSETEAGLRSLTGADEIVFFDATVRHEPSISQEVLSSQSAHLRVHVDQNPNSALARAVNHCGAVQGFRRFQIINVWRPLLAPVRNYPLALCDYRTVNLAKDLVPTRLIFPSWLKDRENYSLKFNPAHRWYFWSSMSHEEALVFKCYDSASRGLAIANNERDREGLLDVAGLCPHTSFFDELGPATGHLRTSLEVRALLFYT